MTVDRWDAGDAYERFMGRWSRPLARAFLATLEQPPGARWLDVGCGTGALTAAIADTQAPASVMGCDPSAAFLDSARRSVVDPAVAFHCAGAGSLPRTEPPFDVVVSCLALNFFPDPLGAVREMASLSRAGGIVATAVWDYAGRMQPLRVFWDAAARLDPGAIELDEGKRFPICRPEPLAELFRGAGLRDVRSGAVEIATPLRSFDDYWAPFLEGTGPAPSYVAGLSADHRAELSALLSATLSPGASGEIPLRARAWTVAGRVLGSDEETP